MLFCGAARTLVVATVAYSRSYSTPSRTLLMSSHISRPPSSTRGVTAMMANSSTTSSCCSSSPSSSPFASFYKSACGRMLDQPRGGAAALVQQQRYVCALTAIRLSSNNNTTNNSEDKKSDASKKNSSETQKDDAVSAQKAQGEEQGEGDDEGFVDEAIVVKDEHGNSVIRIRHEPLSLIEEVPLPQRVLTDIELVMMAWCEEHARQYALLLAIVRFSIFILLFIILYVFYKTQLSSERVLRGVNNVPSDLRIGNVVYFDIAENGIEIGRVVIGLLTDNCPLYCEYFHRKCTGNGNKKAESSFRGMRLTSIVPRHALIFGDGREMTHDVPGFNPHYLPTENLGKGAWRGALSSIAYGPDRESPNFAIHVSSGDYKPQVFGIVMGGYNVIERMNAAGSKHGNSPKRQYVVQDCGELCTLAKSHVTPMPWRLYETVSVGYDEEKFGAKADPHVLFESDMRSAERHMKMEEQKRKKRFWFF